MIPSLSDCLRYIACWFAAVFLLQVGVAFVMLSPYECTWCKIPSLGLFLLAKLVGVFLLLVSVVALYCPIGMYQQKYMDD
jgi:hypothetical protein